MTCPSGVTRPAHHLTQTSHLLQLPRLSALLGSGQGNSMTSSSPSATITANIIMIFIIDVSSLPLNPFSLSLRVLRLQRALKRHDRSRSLSASVASQFIGKGVERWLHCRCWVCLSSILGSAYQHRRQALVPSLLTKRSLQPQTNFFAPTGVLPPRPFPPSLPCNPPSPSRLSEQLCCSITNAFAERFHYLLLSRCRCIFPHFHTNPVLTQSSSITVTACLSQAAQHLKVPLFL